jgi:hypothetical protein
MSYNARRSGPLRWPHSGYPSNDARCNQSASCRVNRDFPPAGTSRRTPEPQAAKVSQNHDKKSWSPRPDGVARCTVDAIRPRWIWPSSRISKLHPAQGLWAGRGRDRTGIAEVDATLVPESGQRGTGRAFSRLHCLTVFVLWSYASTCNRLPCVATVPSRCRGRRKTAATGDNLSQWS